MAQITANTNILPIAQGAAGTPIEVVEDTER